MSAAVHAKGVGMSGEVARESGRPVRRAGRDASAASTGGAVILPFRQPASGVPVQPEHPGVVRPRHRVRTLARPGAGHDVVGLATRPGGDREPSLASPAVPSLPRERVVMQTRTARASVDASSGMGERTIAAIVVGFICAMVLGSGVVVQQYIAAGEPDVPPTGVVHTINDIE